MSKKFLVLHLMCFLYTLYVPAQDNSVTPAAVNNIQIDTVRIPGYVVALGKTMYRGTLDSAGKYIPNADSGYYSNIFFVPIYSTLNNSIGDFIDMYYPIDSAHLSNGPPKLTNIFLMCFESDSFRCDYFGHTKTYFLNKYIKSVLPRLITNKKYIRVGSQHGWVQNEYKYYCRAFYVDGVWLKLSLPRKYNYNTGVTTWPVVPNIKKDFCTYYILIDYYAFSSDVDLKDAFLIPTK